MTDSTTKRIPSFRLVNGTQLGQILGVSAQRISTLVHHGLPRLEDSKLYDLAEVVPWSIQRALEKGDVQGSGSARQQYYEAMTEKAQLDAERLRGNLYDREATDQFFMAFLTKLRQDVLALPERVTRDRKIAAALDKEISASLEGLADTLATWIEQSGGDVARASDAATNSDGGRVGER